MLEITIPTNKRTFSPYTHTISLKPDAACRVLIAACSWSAYRKGPLGIPTTPGAP